MVDCEDVPGGLMTVFLYYIGIAVTCTISACVHGAKLSADFSVDLLEHLYGDSMNYVSQSDMILISVLLPFAISVLMTEVQMLFSFCLHPLKALLQRVGSIFCLLIIPAGGYREVIRCGREVPIFI